MEDRKYLKLLSILILGGIVIVNGLFVSRAQAYNEETHGFLTETIFDFYNQHFPHKTTPSELKAYLVDGARKEDDMPRWLNHFYDPVHNQGLADGPYQGESAKTWAQSPASQTKLVYRAIPFQVASILNNAQKNKIDTFWKQTDFTWQRAIDLYAHGEKEKALFALGHVLHLIEDLSVPDHTRNDAHPPYDEGGSPYEKWTAQFNLKNPDKAMTERLRTRRPISLNNLDSFFDSMASYSNHNFYSKNSIGKYDEPFPKKIEVIKEYAYGLASDNGKEYKLVRTERGFLNLAASNESIKIEPKKSTIDSPVILYDYWSLLSTKAVQHGAGVLHLFLQEAEKARASYLLDKSRRPILGRLIDGFNNTPENLDEQIAATPIPEIIAVLSLPPPSTPTPTSTPSPTPSPRQTPPPPRPTSTATPSPPPKSSATPTPTPSLTPALTSSFPCCGGGYSGGSTPLPDPSPSPTPTSTPVAPEVTPVPNDSPELAVEPLGEAAPAPLPSHLLISEIQVAGVDAGDEFIELYNPTSQEVLLDNWSIQYVAGVASSSAQVIKKNFVSPSKIPAQGFFLLARGKDSGQRDGYTGNITPDLAHRSFSLSGASRGGKIFLVSDQEKIADFNDPHIIDRVGYGFAVPDKGQSLERQAKINGLCVSPQSTNEYEGNGCDTDNDPDDFVIRLISRPQNSQSLTEPRPAPPAPPNFQVSYDPPNLEITGRWDQVEPSASYQLWDTSMTPASLLIETKARAFSYKITQIGRKFSYQLKYGDREGRESLSANANLDIPGFLSTVKFYPKATSSYRLKLQWSSYPFIPITLKHLASGQIAPDNWQAVLVYYNQVAPRTDDLFWSAPPQQGYQSWGLITPGGLTIKYPNCFGGSYTTTGSALIVPATPKQCSGLAGNYSSYALDWKQLASNSLNLEVLASNFSGRASPSANDFISLSFYAFQPGYEPNNTAIRYLATDQQKYFFKLEP